MRMAVFGPLDRILSAVLRAAADAILCWVRRMLHRAPIANADQVRRGPHWTWTITKGSALVECLERDPVAARHWASPSLYVPRSISRRDGVLTVLRPCFLSNQMASPICRWHS